MDHIAHQPGLDGQAFHLTDPKGQRSGEVINQFAKAAHAPHLAMRIDSRLIQALPKGTLSMLMKLPALKDVRKTVLADFGIPEEVVDFVGLTAQFDTRDTERALEGSGITLPKLDTYADLLWDYWERSLDPDLFRDRSFEGAVNGKVIVITGASSGIGKATAEKVARAGGIPVLLARSVDKLEETKKEIEDAGGTAYVYPVDLSDLEAIDEVVKRILADHPAVDMLVNNAGRSIRRSLEQAYDRFHDYERTMQLNYFGAIRMIIALMPHFRERRRGHIINVSSIGVQTSPPRFSAYVASKAALDAFTRCVGSEVDRRRRDLHDHPHAAGQDGDDRADEDLRQLPDHHARRGGGHDLRGHALEAQARGHAAGDVRRGRLRAAAQGRGPDPPHGLQGLPRLGAARKGGPKEGEKRRRRRPRPRRSRSRTSCAACTGSPGRPRVARAATALAGVDEPAASADRGVLDPLRGWRRVTSDFDTVAFAAGVAIGPDGSVCAGGSYGEANLMAFAVTKWRADGGPDPTFGDNGQVELQPASSPGAANGVALSPDGKVALRSDCRDGRSCARRRR